MKSKTSYVYIRLTPNLKAQLKAEASICEESMQTYIVSIIRYRKRIKQAIPTEKGYYSGY